MDDVLNVQPLCSPFKMMSFADRVPKRARHGQEQGTTAFQPTETTTVIGMRQKLGYQNVLLIDDTIKEAILEQESHKRVKLEHASLSGDVFNSKQGRSKRQRGEKRLEEE